MSTNVLVRNPVSTIPQWKSYPLAENPFTVSATTSVNADRNRIYQALTVPEYVEAWFHAPGAIAGRTAVSAGQSSFSISYWLTPRQQCKICCSYQVQRRSKLVFSWQHATPTEMASSLVKVRLLGDFGRTTVHVTHAGLNLSDQEWHRGLWVMSLENLSKLF